MVTPQFHKFGTRTTKPPHDGEHPDFLDTLYRGISRIIRAYKKGSLKTYIPYIPYIVRQEITPRQRKRNGSERRATELFAPLEAYTKVNRQSGRATPNSSSVTAPIHSHNHPRTRSHTHRAMGNNTLFHNPMPREGTVPMAIISRHFTRYNTLSLCVHPGSVIRFDVCQRLCDKLSQELLGEKHPRKKLFPSGYRAIPHRLRNGCYSSGVCYGNGRCC
jgi:hypothetical protein